MTFIVFSLVGCKDKETVTKEECEKDETKQWNAEANEGKGVCETKVKTSSEAYVDECNKIHDELMTCYEKSFSLPIKEQTSELVSIYRNNDSVTKAELVLNSL